MALDRYLALERMAVLTFPLTTYSEFFSQLHLLAPADHRMDFVTMCDDLIGEDGKHPCLYEVQLSH